LTNFFKLASLITKYAICMPWSRHIIWYITHVEIHACHIASRLSYPSAHADPPQWYLYKNMCVYITAK
jgi:hypothetical protein